MSESMGQWPGKIKEKASDVFIEKFAQEAVQQLREGGWRKLRENLIANYLKNLGVVPRFLQENEPEFSEMRHKLNTKPGVIICNHPGGSESPTILSVLDREDLKIMIDDHLYKVLPSDVAKKYFFSAYSGPKSLTATLGEIDAHIKGGGVMLFYPRLRTQDSFQGTFRKILQETLKPEDMIYCFNVNTTDTDNLFSLHPLVGMGSEVVSEKFLGFGVNINKIRKPITIRTAENYTQAEEWSKAIAGVPEDNANAVLTEKYEGMFSANK